MQVQNEIRLQFPSLSANEGFARMAVAAFAAPLDPTLDELADLKTAVSEAVTNCIVHAYRDTVGTVYIHARILEGGRIVLKIRDRGVGIPDVAQAMEPMFTTDPGGERAGLGFAVMASFMDRLRVKSSVGTGTTVTMEKTIHSRRKIHG